MKSVPIKCAELSTKVQVSDDTTLPDFGVQAGMLGFVLKLIIK